MLLVGSNVFVFFRDDAKFIVRVFIMMQWRKDFFPFGKFSVIDDILSYNFCIKKSPKIFVIAEMEIYKVS